MRCWKLWREGLLERADRIGEDLAEVEVDELGLAIQLFAVDHALRVLATLLKAKK